VTGSDPSSPGASRDALLADEARLWTEVQELIGSMPFDQVDRPGYFSEGWSAKDLVGHLGSWLAEAGAVLERIRFGTFRPEEIDVDALNATFFRALHDVPFRDVRAQGIAARHRMLQAWGALEEPSPQADWWIRKTGPEHYGEHLPRLREWVDQVHEGGA
jgi:Mycothiol maleylpyruvate isomerase N-terminal domain